MKVNVYLAVAFGAVAYIVGRELTNRQTKAMSATRPLPPLPPPPGELHEIPESASVPGVENAWDSLEFEVDIFPAGASRMVVMPPWNPKTVSSSSTCDVIAVGADWWSEAKATVKAKVASGENLYRAVESVLDAELPHGCSSSNSVAYAMVRDELADKLAAVPLVVTMIPNPRSYDTTIGQSILSLLTGVPAGGV